MQKPNRMTLTFSVVLSFRNEKAIIPELVKRLCAVLDGECRNGNIENYELIFVNDDSTDG